MSSQFVPKCSAALSPAKRVGMRPARDNAFRIFLGQHKLILDDM